MNNQSILRALALGVAVTAAALTTASAQTTTNATYITTNDFGQFNGGSGTVTSAFYSVTDTTNGIGNSSAPGATGGFGSLVTTVPVGGYSDINLTGGGMPGPTAAVFTALSPGSTSGNMLAGSGTLTFDLYAATSGSMSQQYGIHFNYNGTYQDFIVPATSTFTGADGLTWDHFVVPYTMNATSLTYFQWSLSEYAQWNRVEGDTLYIDNIQVISTAAVPEPSTIALVVMGGLGAVILIRRRRVEA